MVSRWPWARSAQAPTQTRRPTVLCYGHFDVQPPDPLNLWESAPFEPEIRGDRLYGRGVADDKGQLYMLLAGARALAQAGDLPVNVRFACDGEEETGGHSIVDFLEVDERGADAAVIFDSGMIREDLPGLQHRHARSRLFPHRARRPALPTCTPASTAVPRSTPPTR